MSVPPEAKAPPELWDSCMAAGESGLEALIVLAQAHAGTALVVLLFMFVMKLLTHAAHIRPHSHVMRELNLD